MKFKGALSKRSLLCQAPGPIKIPSRSLYPEPQQHARYGYEESAKGVCDAMFDFSQIDDNNASRLGLRHKPADSSHESQQVGACGLDNG